MKSTTALSSLSLSDAIESALLSRGIRNVEQLSDLLHGSPPSQQSLQQLLKLDSNGLTALVASVDLLVDPDTASKKIGRLGAVCRYTKPEGPS